MSGLIRALIACIALAWTACGWAGGYVSGQFVYSAVTYSGGTAPAQSLPGDATPGNWIIVSLAWDVPSRNFVSLTDTAGTTYTAFGSKQAGGLAMQTFRGLAASATAGDSVVAVISGGSDGHVSVVEVSGLASDQSGALVVGQEQVSVTSYTTGSLTPTNTSGIAVAFVYRTPGDHTDDGSFTALSSTTAAIGYYANPPASSLAWDSTSVDNEVSSGQLVWLAGAASSSAVPTILSVNQ